LIKPDGLIKRSSSCT